LTGKSPSSSGQFLSAKILRAREGGVFFCNFYDCACLLGKPTSRERGALSPKDEEASFSRGMYRFPEARASEGHDRA
jgi:hypothetical protein